MFGKLRDLIQNKTKGPQDDHDRFMVAACVLFLEVAGADETISEGERAAVERILKDRFNLNGPAVTELALAAARKRDQATDLFQFSQVLNKGLAEDEKIKIVEALWEIVYADNVVDENEEYLLRRFSALLDLNHSKMIAAKLKVRDRLDESAR